MMKMQILPCLLLLMISSVTPRSRTIDFDKEIRNALHIRYVKVTGYMDSSMTVSSSKTTMRFNCIGKPMTDMIRKRMLEINKQEQEMKGHWPIAGDSVLVVADSSYNIRLFAIKKGTDYQFWDPNTDLNGSWFRFSKPARPTDYCAKSFPDQKQENDCFDGCLYEIRLIKER